MTDRDPIGICIEARARDLHAALADLVDSIKELLPTNGDLIRAEHLLREIEAEAQRAVPTPQKAIRPQSLARERYEAAWHEKQRLR